LKKVQTTWSVVSFVGFQAGSERLEGRTTIRRGLLRSVHPFGIGWSQPIGRHKRYWGSTSPRSIWASSRATIQPECRGCGDQDSISTVLSPVCRFIQTPDGLGLSPSVWGMSIGHRVRTVTGVDGQQTKLDSSRIMLTVAWM